MAKAKIVKPAGMKPVKLVQPAKIKKVNAKQAMQGPMGKAQGYLGHLSGKPVDLKQPKQKKEKK